MSGMWTGYSLEEVREHFEALHRALATAREFEEGYEVLRRAARPCGASARAIEASLSPKATEGQP